MRLCLRRLPLYASAAAVVLALSIGTHTFLHLRNAETLISVAFSPIVIAIVIVFVAADARGDATTPGQRWERVLERFWAVLILDFVQSVISIAANVGMAYAFSIDGSSIQGFLLSALSIVTLGLLVYSDVYAAVEPAPSVLLLVPFACVRSMMLALGFPNRALSLVFIAVGISGVLSLIPGPPHAHFAIQTALALFIQIPLAALMTLFYLDVLARESARNASP